MIKGVIREGQVVDMFTCLTTTEGIRDFECPFDTHYAFYLNKLPSVSTIVDLRSGKCLLKQYLRYNVPLYIDPRDIYYVQRGTVFHEKLYETLVAKELQLIYPYEYNEEKKHLFGRIDGIYISGDKFILMDLKTKASIFMTKEGTYNVPSPEHILQTAIYVFMFEYTYRHAIDYIDIFYHTWSDYVRLRFACDFSREKIKDILHTELERFHKLLDEGEVHYDGDVIFAGSYDFNIPDTEDRYWECQYCPYWLICKYGRSIVRVHRLGKLTGRGEFYTTVGYDLYNLFGVETKVIDCTDIDERFANTKHYRHKYEFSELENVEGSVERYISEVYM